MPHPVALPAQLVRPGSRVIGDGTSHFVANQHGLRWFLDAVWPQLAAARVSFEVAGHVASMLPRVTTRGVEDMAGAFS